MKHPVAGCGWLLTLAVGACSGQGPQETTPYGIEVKLPPEVYSERVFVRYVPAGDEFGGWVQPPSGVSSFVISPGNPVPRIRAILYAPGCAIQTVDLPLSGWHNQPYAFTCRPLRSVVIEGALSRIDRLYGREVRLEAQYVAGWAQSFLRLPGGIVTTIPVGDAADVAADGRFRLSVPDLSQDPLAGAADHPGELRILAKDKAGRELVAQLIPTGPHANATRMGGLKIQVAYPAETAFVPCVANPPQGHDAEGFALRSGPADACDR